MILRDTVRAREVAGGACLRRQLHAWESLMAGSECTVCTHSTQWITQDHLVVAPDLLS